MCRLTPLEPSRTGVHEAMTPELEDEPALVHPPPVNIPGVQAQCKEAFKMSNDPRPETRLITRRQFTLGAAYDGNSVGFQQSSQLGFINPDRSVTGVDAFGDGVTGGEVDGEPYDTRVNLRGRGYGPAVVEEIAKHYGEPIVAMSLGESSDSFWRSLGWTAHAHPEYSRNRTLFTSI